MSRPELSEVPDRPFEAPWQAQAFALTVALHERGLFTWKQWAQALSAEVNGPAAAADGRDYYRHWLQALEKLLARQGLADAATVGALAQAWQRAAHATPHGKPIRLENDPLHAAAPSDFNQAKGISS